MEPVHVAAEDRAAYHAAASIASNFLITLETAAERLAGTAGISRQQLLSACPRNGRELGRPGSGGADRAGRPRRRAEPSAASASAIAARTPELLELFDQLVSATWTLSRPTPVAA